MFLAPFLWFGFQIPYALKQKCQAEIALQHGFLDRTTGANK